MVLLAAGVRSKMLLLFSMLNADITCSQVYVHSKRRCTIVLLTRSPIVILCFRSCMYCQLSAASLLVEGRRFQFGSGGWIGCPCLQNKGKWYVHLLRLCIP